MVKTPMTSRARVVVAGDQGVGKSSLLRRLIDDEFHVFSTETIGVDFVVKRLESSPTKRKIKLEIWDTAGQERFMAISKTYFRQAQLIMLCYDSSSIDSLAHLKSVWWPLIASQANPAESLLFIVGTKCDLPTTSTSTTMESIIRDEWMAGDGYGMWTHHVRPRAIFYMTTSSKLGSNIAELFQFAAENLESHDLLLPPREDSRSRPCRTPLTASDTSCCTIS